MVQCLVLNAEQEWTRIDALTTTLSKSDNADTLSNLCGIITDVIL